MLKRERDRYTEKNDQQELHDEEPRTSKVQRKYIVSWKEHSLDTHHEDNVVEGTLT